MHMNRFLLTAASLLLSLTAVTGSPMKAEAFTMVENEKGKQNQGVEPSYALDDEAWRKKLSAEQYRVLREEGTELPHSSPLNAEKRAGVFHCAACGEALYLSDDKFESGSGWPSFTQPVSNAAVKTKLDYKMLVPRTEVRCSKCGSHLGHVFNDGPKEATGLRYCINGAALTFAPGETSGEE